ncbi:MAG: hypothetical protein GF353_29035 [Candidatus Lokiarchaeota archaeon]|nr:hypothetical protein [Candidatus Lokiarchaeota archaeon]
MSTISNYKDFTVRILGDKKNGSGCLIQAMSENYYYVLTAKHIIENNESIEISYIPHSGAHQILKKIEHTVHSDPSKDAAIIKIEKTFDLNFLSKSQNLLSMSKYFLCGFPEVRESNNENDRFRPNEVKNIFDKGGIGYLEGEIIDRATQEEVKGQSGGGIYYQENGCFYVVGIQKGMAAEKHECQGRIEIMPISFFDEIVDENSNDFAPILPPYMICFSKLINEIFTLNGSHIKNSLDYVKLFLRNVGTNEICNCIRPIELLEFQEDLVLVYGENKTALLNQKYFISWLEHLIVNKILNVICDKVNIEEIQNKNRLLFSETTDDWSCIFENILRSDFRGLKKKRNVFISTNSVPRKPVINPKYAHDIARAYPIDDFKIDSGSHPLKEFKLIHIDAFQSECIIKKELKYKKYSALNNKKLRKKLRNEFEKIIN